MATRVEVAQQAVDLAASLVQQAVETVPDGPMDIQAIRDYLVAAQQAATVARTLDE